MFSKLLVFLALFCKLIFCFFRLFFVLKTTLLSILHCPFKQHYWNNGSRSGYLIVLLLSFFCLFISANFSDNSWHCLSYSCCLLFFLSLCFFKFKVSRLLTFYLVFKVGIWTHHLAVERFIFYPYWILLKYVYFGVPYLATIVYLFLSYHLHYIKYSTTSQLQGFYFLSLLDLV